MASVRATPAADADLDEILGYLRREAGVRVALDYDLALEELYARLAAYPDSGALRPRLGRGVRVGVVQPYIVAYRHDVGSDEVVILRIVHGARRLSARMLSGSES